MHLLLKSTLLLSLSFTASVANAQEMPKPSPKCNEVIVRDSSHPVWKAIDTQYGKLAEALRKKDLDTLFALYTPDYQVRMPNGVVWNREKSLAYQRGGYALVKETTHISNTILRLAVCGDEATVTVLQQWYRTQLMFGKLRRVETNAVQDETWVKTSEGWKRGNLYEISSGANFIDGKRVDITKPDDPEAPAYDPYDPRPKKPVAEALFPLLWKKASNRLLSSIAL